MLFIWLKIEAQYTFFVLQQFVLYLPQGTAVVISVVTSFRSTASLVTSEVVPYRNK